MYVFHDIRTIYIRIPKTGSSSFLASMRPKHEYEWVGRGKGRHAEHFTALVTREKYIERNIWNEYNKIAFIRNPYGWVRSLYNLKETKDAFGEDNTLPFPEFVANLKTTMYHWITNQQGHLMVDEVFRLEDLDEILRTRYGVHGTKHINQTNKKEIILSSTDRAIIDKLFWREWQSYGEEKDMVIVKRKSIVEGIEYAPEERGLTRSEINQLQKPTNPEPDTKIIDIKSSRAGEIVVAKEDGHRYRRFGGTIAWRQNNPGNIKYGPFAKSTSAVGTGHGNHAVYATLQDGKQAMWELLFTDVRDFHNKTIYRALAKYAPTSDGNKPKRYAGYVASKVGVPTTTKLNELTPDQQSKMIDAMIVFEGWKLGQESIVT